MVRTKAEIRDRLKRITDDIATLTLELSTLLKLLDENSPPNSETEATVAEDDTAMLASPMRQADYNRLSSIRDLNNNIKKGHRIIIHTAGKGIEAGEKAIVTKVGKGFGDRKRIYFVTEHERVESHRQKKNVSRVRP